MPKQYRKLPPTSVEPKQTIGAADAWHDEIFGAVDLGTSPSKDHRQFYPTKEIQSYGDCLSFSYTNVLETICREKNILDDDGNEVNLADLHLAVGSGTTQRGNNFNNVAEWLRKNGVVLEKFAPYTRVWEDRQKVFNAIPAYAKRYAKGTGHAWVKTDRNSLKNALDVPLWIAVGLGETYQNNPGTADRPVTPPQNVSVYHAIENGYIDDEDKVYTYDNYQRSEVVYSANYPILYAKMLTPQGLPDGWQVKNADGKRLLARLLGKYVIRGQTPPAHGELYYLYPDGSRMQYLPDVGAVPWFQEFLQFLRTNNKLIGVNEIDHLLITDTIKANGGVIN